MAQVVKLKRTSVEGKVPSTSNLELGELAMNTYDGRIFFERDNGTPSVQQVITTNSQTTGSINVQGNVTASYFFGDGSGLTNLPAADVSQVATVTSSFDNQSSISVTHNFNSKNIIVSVYGTDDTQIIPSSVTLTNSNSINVGLSANHSGYIVVAKGGHIVSGSAADAAALNGELGSYYLDYTNFTNIPSGIISGSAQLAYTLDDVTNNGNTTTTDIFVSSSKSYYLGANSYLRRETNSGGFESIQLNGSIYLKPNTSVSANNGVVIGGNGYLLAPNSSRNAQLNYGSVSGQFGVYKLNVYGSDATFQYNVNVSGNISGSSFNGTGLISGSSQITDLTTYTEDVSGNSTYTITHNLNEEYPIVQAWNTSSKRQEIPSIVESTSVNALDITFSTTFAGRIIVKK